MTAAKFKPTTITLAAPSAAVQFGNLALFASTPDRPVLTGIRLEVAGKTVLTRKVEAVCTDSYALCLEVLEAEVDGPAGAWTIPAKELGAFAKANRKAEMLALRFDVADVIVTAGGSSLVLKLIDGDYPKWRALLPDVTDKPVDVAFDPRMLARVAKVRSTDDSTSVPTPHRWFVNGAGKPSTAKVGTATVIQMPVRVA